MKCFSIKWEKDIKFGGLPLHMYQSDFKYTQKKSIHKIKYLQVFLVYKKILNQFDEIKFLKLLQYHQIDIKFSCLQEKSTSTLFYG